MIFTRPAQRRSRFPGAPRPLHLKESPGAAEILPVGHWLDALAKASTGNRVRHRTPDSGAESSPASRRPDDNSVAREAQGISRRALLRRGAVIGAAVWTTPVLQTALAPAASASACTIGCVAGTTCTTNTNCATGLCLNGICAYPHGTPGACTANNQCQSGNCFNGTCTAQWPGTTCTANNQCLSGKCVGGRCFENALGQLCSISADCTDNTTCPPTGSPRVCGGVGALCANNNKCTTNKCRGGVCVP